MTHIPYRGTALAVADLVAGQVTMVFGDPVSGCRTSTPAPARAGGDRPGALAGGAAGADHGGERLSRKSRRSPGTASSRRRRTPPAIIEKLNSEIVKACNPDIKALLSKQAMEPVGDTPQEFVAFIQKDIATWKEVAAMANVSVE